MQIVILAGGLGTRMRPATQTVPKALLPVAGRPFADVQLSLLSRQGADDVLYAVGHLGFMIKDFVRDGRRWGLRVSYVDEGDELRGTGGALRLAYDQDLLQPAFGVLYGDSYLPLAVAPVNDAFERASTLALMTVFRNNGRFGPSNAAFDNGLVRYRKSAPAPDMHYIDYGLSYLRREVVRDHVTSGAHVDLADVFEYLSDHGQLAGHEVFERFYEVGSPQGLSDLEAHLGVGS